jgi:hypothetical protein
MKNIPMPSQKVYLQMFINSIEKFSRNLNWRAHFFLNPPSETNSKENFGFKSLAPAPFVKELKHFQDGLISLVKDVKFENRHNTFQNKLEKDLKEIKTEKRLLVAGDKSTNFHKMSPRYTNSCLKSQSRKNTKKPPLELSKVLRKRI